MSTDDRLTNALHASECRHERQGYDPMSDALVCHGCGAVTVTRADAANGGVPAAPAPAEAPTVPPCKPCAEGRHSACAYFSCGCACEGNQTGLHEPAAPAEAPKPEPLGAYVCPKCYQRADRCPCGAECQPGCTCLEQRTGAAPPARETPKPEHWLNPFHDCGACRTLTHCGHHRRCLAECTPADLVVSGETAAPDYSPTEQACKGCMGPCGHCETIAAERTAAPEGGTERPRDTYVSGEPMPQYAVLGIGVDAWVDLTEQEKPRQDGRRLSDGVVIRRSTFDVVMRVLRAVRLRDFRPGVSHE